MSNPARMLADLLERWIVPKGASVTNVRTEALPDGFDFWKMQRIAAGYLSEIEQCLDAMDGIGGDTSDFRATMDDWCRAVFLPEQPWHGAASVETRLDPRDLRLLRALANQIDMMDMSPSYNQEQAREILDLLDEVRSVVVGATGLPAAVRAYILGLVTEAENALLDLEVFGESRLRALTIELGGAIVTTIGTVQSDASPGLREKLGGLAFRIFTKVGINVVIYAMSH